MLGFKIFFPKRTFPSDFVKLVSKILYLFLAEKWSFVVCLFCFVLFVATLSDFGLLKKKIEVLIELRRMLIRNKKKVLYVRFGNCSTVKYPDSADLLDLQRCNWPNL